MVEPHFGLKKTTVTNVFFHGFYPQDISPIVFAIGGNLNIVSPSGREYV